MMMHAKGHTTTWGMHIGVGRGRDAKGWYQQLKEWWAAHKVAREEARLAALRAQWDAKRETVMPYRADSAADMAVTQHAVSIATMLYGLNQ